MKTKHTPGPWGIEDTGNHLWIGPRLRSDGRKIDEIVIHLDIEGLREDAAAKYRANAAFIVRACNAHADLLAALERFVGYADQHTHTEVLDEIATQARAALDKAGRGVEGGGE